ncbi:MAG: 3-phosphoshikimate 1-carboxyvinyltransferase, partial [Methylophilaceae bacterium]
MKVLDLAPVAHVGGAVKLPGSKSISNRTLLLAALSQGTTTIRDLLASDDTARMLEALDKLGIKLEQLAENDWLVQGCAGQFPNRQADLFLGNAGTAFRPLTAALAFAGGEYQLTGVARMHERPIGDLVDALLQAGAHIDYLQQAGFPPLAIHPAQLKEHLKLSIRGNVSSQFLTALLMALPMTGKAAEIVVEGELISKPYISITLNLMRQFGVDVQVHGDMQGFSLSSGLHYQSPGQLYVEGDASSASYFLAAGAIAAGRNGLRIEGVSQHSIQGDIRFVDEIAKMGAQIEYADNAV